MSELGIVLVWGSFLSALVYIGNGIRQVVAELRELRKAVTTRSASERPEVRRLG